MAIGGLVKRKQGQARGPTACFVLSAASNEETISPTCVLRGLVACSTTSHGSTYDEVIEAGEHIPGMAALWDVATPEERREMVILMLEPGGMYLDLELKIVAAIKPRPAFLPILRMLNGVVEYDETKGLLLVEHW